MASNFDVNVLLVDRTHPAGEKTVRLWMGDGYDSMMNHHAKEPLARFLMIATLEGQNGYENIVNASPQFRTLLTMLVTRLERVRTVFRSFGRSQFAFNVDAVLAHAEKDRLDKMLDSYVAMCEKAALTHELQPGEV